MRSLLYTTALTVMAVLPGFVARANPLDGNVVAGSATIVTSDKAVDITQQSDRAVIDWRSFNIGVDERTRFIQPNANAIVVNRVKDSNPSAILGSLSANGNVVLINPNGVFFGKNATVDVNGLVATTADIDNEKFMAGSNSFDKASTNTNAAIINEGQITAKDAGLIGLVAPNVINNGIINAKLGRAELASGDTVTVDFRGNGLTELAVSDDVKSQIISNTGAISAAGGTIAITAAAGKNIVNSLINIKGELKAPSVAAHDGKISIFAAGSNAVVGNVGADKGVKSGSSNIVVQATLDVSGRNKGEHGGKVVITGDNVALLDGTVIDASGYEGKSGTTTGKEKSAQRIGSAGGEVLIGGNYLGGGDTPNAKNLYVGSGVVVLNDALNSGDAGRTIFWSDNNTAFYGNVYARALGGVSIDPTTYNAISGGNSGDGGFVETSGHNHLDAGGYVDLTASNGARGTYFLDPTNITIYGNVDPTFVSTDGTVNLANSLKLWLDYSDKSKIQLSYSSEGFDGGSASGTVGSNTITLSGTSTDATTAANDLAYNLAVGARIRLNGAGSVTAADVIGADTYTIASISGLTITLTSNLTQNYSGTSIFRGLVSQATDKSGAGNNATQSNLSNMPLFIDNYQNGTSAVKFDGGNDYQSVNLDFLAGNSMSAFVGAYTTAYSNIFGAVNGGQGANSLHVGFANSSTYRENYWGNDFQPGISSAYNYSGVDLLGYQWLSGDSKFVATNAHYEAGSGSGSAGVISTMSGGGVIGAVVSGANWGGTMTNMIVYNSALSGDAQALVYEYQSAKLNIALNPLNDGTSEVAQVTGTNGFSAFTTRYLERLSQSADISLQASNNITLDLKGDTLAMAANKSLTLTAGNNILTASNGTITASGTGNITLNATNGINLTNNMNFNTGASGAVTFNGNINGGSNLAVSSGTVNFNGSIGATTALGTLNVTGTTYLSGNVTTNNANILFNSPVWLRAAVGVNAGTGNVTFASTVDSVAATAAVNSVQALVVAGGGGSGGNNGGGGGGGGVIYNSSYAISVNGLISVSVGAGGAGTTNAYNSGSNGNNSVFGSITALGGGGGTSREGGPASAGGSGGGGAGTLSNSDTPGAGTPGQGNSGGNGTVADQGGDAAAGGGGGAGGAGYAGVRDQAGAGGAGAYYTISGTSVAYGGGGGGGDYYGLGGNGGVGGGGHGSGNNVSATNGAANTGGGGGGSAASGGSGVVIVRYTGVAGDAAVSGGVSSTVGSDTVWTFTNGSGTFKYVNTAATSSGNNALTVNAANVTFGGAVGSAGQMGVVNVTGTSYLNSNVTTNNANISFNSPVILNAASNLNAGTGKIYLAGNVTTNNNNLIFNSGVILKSTIAVNGGTGNVTFASTVDSTAAGSGVNSVQALVVAGGGGGGANGGGGGGAGGVLYNSAYGITVNGTISVSVGTGGAASNSIYAIGSSGTNSTFGTLTASGGGGGASRDGGGPAATGGSGGGGAGSPDNSQRAGTAGTSGQGNAGANGLESGGDSSGGGGGGAGGAGVAGTSDQGGAGGAGAAYSITGTSVTYAGGGGGGYVVNGTGGAGGAGGGGAFMTNGVANTGGGGGGGYNGANGGAGGSGVVIIRYTGVASDAVVTGGVSSTVGGDTVWKFTSGSGTFQYVNASGATTGNNGLTVNAANVTFNGAVGGAGQMGAVNVTGTTYLNAGVTTNNANVNLNSAVVLGAAGNINAGTGTATFGGTVNGNYALNTTAATINVNNVIGGTTALGAVTFNGATNLNSNITTNNANVTFANAVTLGANSAINAGTATTAFNSTINGAYNLSATSSTITLGGAIGGTTPTGNITLTAVNSLTLPAITTAAGKTVTATVTGAGNSITASTIATGTGGNITLTADDLVIGGALSGTGTVTLRPNAITRIVNVNSGTADGTNFNLSTTELANLTAGWSSIVVGNTTDNGAFNVGAATWTSPVFLKTNNGDITITGAQAMGANSFTAQSSGTGKIIFSTASITTTASGAAVTLTGAVSQTGTNSITANSGTVAFSSTVDGAGNLTVGATGITFGGAIGGTTATGNITLTSVNSVTLPAITTAAGKTVSVTVTGAANKITTSTIATGAAGIITLVSDDIAIGGNLSGTGTLTLKPNAVSRVIDIATGANDGTDYNLTAAEVAYIQSGFSGVTLGSASQTGNINLGTATWAAPLTVLTSNGNINFVGTTSMGSKALTATTSGTGSIGFNNGTISSSATGVALTLTSNTTITSVNSNSISLSAGTMTATSVGAMSLAPITSKGVTASISGAGNKITTSSIAVGTSGNITLTSDDVAIGGALSGTGTLTLQPTTATRVMNINTGPNDGTDYNISTAELANLTDGWNLITIGRSTLTAAPQIGAATFTDPVSFISSSAGYGILGALTGTGNASFTFGTGTTSFTTAASGITTAGGLVNVQGAFKNISTSAGVSTISTSGGAVTLASLVNDNGGGLTVNSGNGNISIGAITSTYAGTHALTLTGGTGTVALTGTVTNTTGTLTLTASGATITPSGAIGTSGSPLGAVTLTAVNSMTLPVIYAASVNATTTGAAANLTAKGITASANGNVTLTSANNINSGAAGSILTSGTGGITLSAGGDISFANALIFNAQGTGALILQANNNIITTANTTTFTTHGGAITLNSDRDGNSSGVINLATYGDIISNGGNITLGGGATPATGYAAGYSTNYTGIQMGYNSVSASGGNIVLNGQGIVGVSCANNCQGISLNNTSISTTGTGSITLNANSGGVAGDFAINGLNANAGTISAVNGNITINGQTASAQSNSSAINSNQTITTTGTGNVIISGITGGALVMPYYSPTITSGGNITYTGDNIGVTTPWNATGTITIKPYTASTAINLGGTNSGLYLSSATIGNLTATGGITIGNAADSGLMTVNANTWNSALNLLSGNGNISFVGTTTMGSKAFTATTTGTGSIGFNTGGITTTGAAPVTLTSNTTITSTGSNTISTATGLITANSVGAMSLPSITTSGGSVVATVTGAGNAITTSTMAVGAGSITLTSDDVAINGALSGTGTITLQANNLSRVIDINTGANDGTDYNITTAELANLTDGWSLINIGRNNSTASVYTGGTTTFKDPTVFRSSYEVGLNTLSGTGDASFSITGNAAGSFTGMNITTAGGKVDFSGAAYGYTAGAGLTITTNGGAVLLSNLSVGTLNTGGGVTVTSSGGNINLNNIGSGTNTGKTFSINAGAGVVAIAGTVTGTEDFTAVGAGITFGGAIGTSGTPVGAVSLNSVNSISLPTIYASSLLVRTTGAMSNITVTGALTTSATGDALVLAGYKFTNAYGANALTANGGGRFLVWTADPANNTLNGQTYAFKQYNATYGVTTVAGAGNGFLYTLAPTATITLTGSVTKTYDGTTAATLAAGNYSVSGAAGGDTLTINNPASGTYADKNVGTNKNVAVSGITLTATNGGAAVYGYTYNTTANATIGIINAAALSITASDAAKTYGTTKTFAGTEFTTAGLASGDSVSGITIASTGAAASANAGTYAITGSAATGTGLSNYTISYVNGSLTVNKAALNITANNTSKTYGTTKTFAGTEFTTSGLVNSDTVSGVTLASTGAPATANVGSYAITGSGATGTGLSNYNVTYTNGSLMVNTAALTVTANSSSKTYGNTLTYAGTEFTTSGLVNSDTVTSASIASTGAAATAAASATPYTVTIGSASGSGLSNYTISYVTGGLTVNKAALNITANNTSKTYGTTKTFAGTEFATSGLVNSDSVSGVTLASTGAVSTANVGSYAITGSSATGSGLSNYNVTYTNGSLTVNTAALTVTANSSSKTYGNTITYAGTEFTTSGLVNSDSVTSASIASTGAAATAAASATPYTVTIGSASGSGLSNYTISYVTGGLTVNKAALNITANNASKTYGTTKTFAGTEFTTSGLVNSDSVSGVSLTSTGAVNTANVGSYAINGSSATGTGLSNYNVTYTNGSLTVNTAALIVTANSGVKTYGNTLTYAGTEFTTSGLVNSDTVTSASITSTGAVATAAASATPYTVTIGSASGSGLSNYTISYVSGGLTVNKAALNITASDASKTYGTTKTFAGTEFTTSGLVNSDSVSGVTLASTGAPATANVGSYAITGSGATGSGLSNYNVTYTNGSLTVNTAALTVTANSGSKTYGNTLTYAGTEFTTSGLVNSDTVTSASITSTGAVATAAASATPYTVTIGSASGSGLSNYTISYVTGGLTVNKAALNITASDASKTYGTTKTFAGTEFTTSGLVNSDSVSGVTLASTGAPATANVGSYAITGSGATGSGLSNYNVTYTNGSLTVNTAALTVTANSGSKTYGNTLTYAGTEFTTSGLVNSDTVTSASITSTGAVATAAASATPYTVTIGSASGSGLSNYTISYVTGGLTVNKAALNITANNASKTYGTTKTFAGTEFTTSGLVNSDSVSGVTLASTGAVNTANVGSYAIIGSGAAGSGLSNYNVTYTNGSLTVNTAALTITANSGTKTYGNTVTYAGTEFTTSGLVNSDTVNNVTLTSAGAAATAAASATPYAVAANAANGTGLGNYTITYVDGALTVNKAALSITANNASKTYGTTKTFAGTEFTTSGLVNSDAVSGVTLASTGAVNTANVGSYAITGSGATGSGLSNYNVTYTNGSLTVNQAALNITANNASKTYGTTKTFAGTEFTTSGLVNTDTVSNVTLASTGAVNTANVGSYAITGSGATGTGLSNYNVTYTNGSLTVNTAALTVTANSSTKTYGNTVTYAGTEFTTSGLVNSDTVTSASIASTGAVATAAASATPYTVTIGSASGSGLSNYTISYVTGGLTVDKAALNITANNASKTYGTTKTFAGTEFTTSGLVNSDSVSGVTLASTGASATANVGSYAITGSSATGSGLSNYNVTYTNGLLTVNQAALNITANNASKTYGTTKTFAGTEFTTSGLVNSDSVSNITLASTGAVNTANVGAYAITASGAAGTGLNNYNITYTNGSLTVNTAALTVTANSSTKTYGNTVTYAGTEFTTSGLVNSDAVTSASIASTGAAATAAASATPYTVTIGSAAGTGLSNYTISYVTGGLTVNKAALNITANNASKTYGTTKTFAGTEFTTSGLVNSDSVSGISLASTGAVNTANVGSYAITGSNATGSGLSNYNVTYTDGSLTVNVAALTVTANSGTKTYGNTVTYAGTEFTTSGLVNSDTVTSASIASTGAAATAAASATPYAVTIGSAAGTGLSNYAITYVNGGLTVNKAALNITANNASKTYGTTKTFAGTEYTASGLVNSDSVSGISLASTGAVNTANVGSYAITGSGATGSGLSNYNVTYTNGSLTVNTAALTVTANSSTKTYGDTVTYTGAEFTTSGLVNSDTVTSASIASTGAAATAAASATPYAVTIGSAAGTGLSNYTISYVSGGLTVDKANLNVTANNANKAYGATKTFNGTEFTTTGLVNSDSVNNVTLASTGADAAADANGSPYTITVSGATGTGLANYNITYTSGLLTIGKAVLTLTANDKIKTYGDTVSFAGNEFTESGLMSGDSISGVTLASIAAAATANYSTSPYAITISSATGMGLDNYAITYVSGNLLVLQKALTVTANDANKTYGTTKNFAGTEFTANGLVNGDLISSVALNSAGAVTTATVAGGPYAINASAATGTGLSNYSIAYVAGHLTIDKAALSVTANDASKTYGTTKTFAGTEFTTLGLVNSDNVTGVTLASSGAAATANASVTPYGITASNATGNGLDNYTISYVNGGLTVNKAALNITANNASKTYGTTKTFAGTEFTTSGLVNSDSVSGVTLASTGAVNTANVGSYAITGSGATGSGLSNYNVTYTDGSLAVNTAALTVTANSGSKIYGNTVNYGGTEFTTSGLVNSDTVTSASIASTGAVATAAASATPYTVTIGSAAGTGLSNYTISYVSGGLTVNKAALNITASDASKTYGTTKTFAGTEFTTSGLVNSDSVSNVTLASNGAVNTANVASYAITGSTATGSGLSNYTITYTDGSLTVNPAVLTVTANSSAKTYGNTVTYAGTEFTTSGLVNSDTVTTASIASTGAAATAAASATPYTVTIGSAAGTGVSNYTISYVSGGLTVNKAALNITASDASKTYGTTKTFAGTEFTASGLVNGDSVSGISLASTGAVNTANVGSYAIIGSGAAGSGLSNYNVTYTNGSLTVNTAALTVTANSGTKTYGNTVTYAGTEFTTSGLVNSDAVNNVTITSAGAAATAAASATPYAVAANAANGTGLGNYTITYVDGALTVNKAALSITANNASKTYGTTKTFAGTEFTASGLVNADSVNNVTLASTGAVNTANVGAYAITANLATGTGLSNYTISYSDGSLTVNAANLTITANNASKTYGTTKTFAGTEFTTSGLVNSDVINTVNLVSTGAVATANASATPYTITASNAAGTGLANYTINYVDGGLTVNTAALTITANNASKTYGTTKTFAGTEFTTSGLVNADSVSSVNLASAGAAGGANASATPYAINGSAATGTGLTNYSIAYVDGGLTVNQAALTVTANNASKTYGTTKNFAGTEFTTSGLVNSDSVNTVTLASLGSTSTAGVSATPYAITASNVTGTGLTNYIVTYVAGDLTVNPAALTITANDKVKTYGTNIVFNGNEFTQNGLVSGDSISSISLSSAGAAATANASATPYTITASNANGSGLSNYTISYVDGNMAVLQKSLSITANDGNKVYGDVKTFTGAEFVTAGLVNSDAVTGVTLTSAGAVAAATVAGGPYDIVASAATGTGLANYSVTYVNGHLTVDKAALLITANDQSKNYGSIATLGSTAFTTIGLKNADAVTGVTLFSANNTTTATVDGGPYDIVASNANGSGLNNYTVSYGVGHLNVDPIALTVTANNAVKNYGATVTFTGNEFTSGSLINGDHIDAISLMSSGADATANVAGSPYAITGSNATGSGLSNYTITYANGQLSVLPVALTITASDLNKTYGTTLNFIGNEFTASGLLNSDSISNVMLVSTGAAATANVAGGPYNIDASNAAGTGLSNYNITYTTGHLNVTPKNLYVRGLQYNKPFGQNLTLANTDFTIRGLRNNDSVSSVNLSSAGAVNSANYGVYAVYLSNASGAGLNNYNIIYVNGTITIASGVGSGSVGSSTFLPQTVEVSSQDVTIKYNNPSLNSVVKTITNSQSLVNTNVLLAADMTNDNMPLKIMNNLVEIDPALLREISYNPFAKTIDSGSTDKE